MFCCFFCWGVIIWDQWNHATKVMVGHDIGIDDFGVCPTNPNSCAGIILYELPPLPCHFEITTLSKQGIMFLGRGYCGNGATAFTIYPQFPLCFCCVRNLLVLRKRCNFGLFHPQQIDLQKHAKRPSNNAAHASVFPQRNCIQN